MGIPGSNLTFYQLRFSLISCNVKFDVTQTMEIYLLAQTRIQDY